MKKLLLILFVCLSIFVASCSTDENGNGNITTIGWILIIAIPVLFVIIGKSGDKQQKKTDAILKKREIKQSDIILMGTYVGGHPKMDNKLEYAVIYPKSNMLKIAKQIGNLEPPIYYNQISIENITDINIEDSSTLEKKITLGRVLLVGVFALAWRKKKKNELAFVTINWNDGKFDHSTIFSFEGKDAMQKANIARNKLIRIAK